MDAIKLAIIGMGNMGCRYAQRIVAGQIEGLELAAVTRVSPERKKQYPEVFQDNLNIYQSADLLFEAVREKELDIDAVLIVTPHVVHSTQTIKALQLGLHVLCDKPAGVYSRQAREMNEEAEKHDNQIFAMMFNQRMNPIYQKMKDIVESGIYGKLKRVNWVVTDWYRPDAYYDSVAWRGTWENDGGGILLNQCPHNLDLLQWICGMPTSVQAFCKEGKYHNIEVEDEVTAYFEFPEGATGTFYGTTGEASGINRLELSFEDALLVYENAKLSVCELGFHEVEYRKSATDQFAKLRGTWKELMYDGENTQYVDMLRNFTNTIQGKEKIFIAGQEGRKSLLISNALYLSSWQRRMIEIPKNIEEEKEFELVFENEMGKKKGE